MKNFAITLLLSGFITSAFSQNVSLAWERIDTTNYAGEFNTLVTDLNNNVYLTGFRNSSTVPEECIIVKYSDNGTFHWEEKFGYPLVNWKNNINEGKVLKISPNGNIILAANTRRFGDKFEIRSYSPSGNLNWNLINDNIQAANGAEGHIADITVLPDNTIGIFANLNYSNGQGNTYSIFKVNGTGQPGWSGTYSPNSAHDYGTSIEHDTAGIIYITGGVFNFDNGSYDFTTLNIHPNGSNDWIARFNHLTGLKDMAYDMVVDNNQNQFITGISEITTGQNDMSTIMQNVYGTRLWQDVYGGSAGLSDTAVGIVTDNLLNSFVVGTTIEDTLGSNKNAITLIKYDGSGNRVWVKKFLGDDNLGGQAKGITIHPWGNVYITGEVLSNSNGKNIFVVCIDPSGQVIWTYTYDGPAGSNDFATDIVVTQDHRIYVSGSTTVGTTRKHLAFKLDQLTSINELNINNSLFSINYIYYSEDLININYSSAHDMELKLSLYDISGKLIYSSNSNISQGNGQLEKNIPLIHGLYFLKFTNNDINSIQKVVVAR